MVAKVCEDHHLFRDIQCLANKYQFTVDDHTELDWLDKTLTKSWLKLTKNTQSIATAPGPLNYTKPSYITAIGRQNSHRLTQNETTLTR